MKSWINYGLGAGIGFILIGAVTLSFLLLGLGLILATAFGITLYYEIKWDNENEGVKHG